MQVPTEYHGREQSYLKHLVLKDYLDQWAHKLGAAARTGRPVRLWYVDTFAGPWDNHDPNFADTSFSIGLDALETAAATWHNRGYPIELSAVFVEKDPRAFQNLSHFLDLRQGVVATTALCGAFGEVAPDIARRLGNDPAFIFVDPFGWKGAAMHHIAPLVRRGSRDVMINVMFDHLNRQKDRVVEHVRLQIGEFFGLEDEDLPGGLDEDELFQFYREQLRQKCGLPFVADLVVPHPTMDRTKFHLVVGGKNKAVLEVFRETERRILGDTAASVRAEAARRAIERSTGQTSLDLPATARDSNYEMMNGRDAERAVEDVLVCARQSTQVFDEIWPQVLQERHLTVSDLRQIVWDMVGKGLIVLPNRAPRERAVKGTHLIALP